MGGVISLHTVELSLTPRGEWVRSPARRNTNGQLGIRYSNCPQGRPDHVWITSNTPEHATEVARRIVAAHAALQAVAMLQILQDKEGIQL